MHVLRALFALTAVAALTGCGSVAPLKPPAGQPLPVKPLMARATPTAEELLTPPDGGAAPLPPTQEPTSSEEAGPATPL